MSQFRKATSRTFESATALRGQELNVTTKISAVAGEATDSSRRAKAIYSARRAVLRVIWPFREYLPENAAMPHEAVTSSLGTMASTAGRTSALWRQQLEIGLTDCGLSYEARHDFFKTYPVEDYYFAGVVALEAAKIRQVYTPEESGALLGEIGDQVDQAANRGDRVLSDMVFDIIGRIDMSAGPYMGRRPRGSSMRKWASTTGGAPSSINSSPI